MLRIAALLLASALASAATAQSAVDPGQISGPATPAIVPGPVVDDRATQAAQISNNAPSAQPPQPLSQPAEGRTSNVEAVAGKDRCDPAVPKEKRSAECRKVIETRAGEYSRPDPTALSPEQKLLLTQEIQGAGDDVANATRRLAVSGEPDNSTEAGIASIVLEQAKPPPKKEEQDPADAAAEAVMNYLSQIPPR